MRTWSKDLQGHWAVGSTEKHWAGHTAVETRQVAGSGHLQWPCTVSSPTLDATQQETPAPKHPRPLVEVGTE